MPWFQKLCRDSGLMIHNIMQPQTKKKVVTEKVEEKQINDKVTLRRTTIEEIEIKQDKDDSR